MLNYEDEVLRDFAAKCPAKVIFFSSRSELSEGFIWTETSSYTHTMVYAMR